MMIIGGLQKFSLLDYPGEISAIVFTVGCNFRCRFCHNPMLVLPAKGELEENHFLTEDDFFRFLQSRSGKLTAVVITGGEPTLQPDLPEFINRIKKMGFAVKLDTNGTNPIMLAALIKAKLVDYIAMDIKSAPKNYPPTTGVEVDFKKIKKSVKIIKDSGLPCEFRTTLVPGLHSDYDIKEIGELIKGAPAWYLQVFKSSADLVDSDLKGKKSFSNQDMEKFKKQGEKYVCSCELR